MVLKLRSIALALGLFCLTVNAWGQLQINDDFSYTAGSLSGQGSWTKSGTGPDLTVTAPGTALTYGGYNGGGGNYIVAGTPSSTATLYAKPFTTGTTLGTNVFYYSMLLKVPAVTATGNYIFAINDGSTNYIGRLWAKSTTGGYLLGVSTQATATYGTTVLTLGTTYLVVVSYQSISGASNDLAKVWINPSLSADLIPNVTPEASQTSAGDPSNVTYNTFVWRNQTTNTPQVTFDALRVAYGSTSATAWTNLDAAASGITMTSVTPSSSLCAGAGVDVVFNATGTYNSGNVFTAQLSDNTGSFTTPTTIGTLSSTATGSQTIYATLPAGPLTAASGAGYSIRVVSSNTAYTSTTSTAITFNGTYLTTPIAISPAIGTYCNGASPQTITVSSGIGSPGFTAPNSGTPSGVAQITSVNSSTYTLTLQAPGTAVYTYDNGTCKRRVQYTVNTTPAISTTAPNARCGTGTVALSATGTGDILNWYDFSGNYLATGAGYTTPSISTTTNYKVAAAKAASQVSGGKPAPVGAAVASNTSTGLGFDANQFFVLNSVDVYPNAASGSVTIALLNSSGTTMQTGSYSITGGSTTVPFTITLNYNVPTGTGYRLLVTSTTQSLERESSSAGGPFNIGSGGGLPGVINGGLFNGGTTPSSSTYYYFYNWKVTPYCESATTIVAATVTSPAAQPTITPPASVPCAGQANNVYSVVGVAGESYSWAVTGAANGWAITSTASGAGVTTISVTAGTGVGSVNVTPSNSGCGIGTSATTGNITPQVAPSAPSGLTGPTAPCINSSGLVYSVTDAGLIYKWSIPAGWSYAAGSSSSGVSSGGLNSITVTSNGTVTALTVSVLANNGSCDGAASVLTINQVNSAPATPSFTTVTSSNNVVSPCATATNLTYGVTSVAGVTYAWSINSLTGWAITANPGTATATMSAGTGSGNLVVAATNACGVTNTNYAVNPVNGAPAQPTAITEPAGTVCASTGGYAYSIPVVSTATSYTWSVPTGWLITSTNGTAGVTSGGNSSITVTSGTSAQTGTISVYATNVCGNGTSRSTGTLTPLQVATPGTITVPSPMCASTGGYTFSVTNDPTVTYTWATTAGWSNGGGNANSVIVTTGSGNGTVTVYASKSGCNSAIQTTGTISGTSVSTPSTINNISSAVCSNAASLTVSVTNSGATYNWSFPSGFTPATATGASVTITGFPATSGPYTISVTGTTGGCTSAARTGNLTVNQPISITSQPVNTTACGENDIVLTVGVNNVQTYSWKYSTASNFSPLFSLAAANGGTSNTATLSHPNWSGWDGYYLKCDLTALSGCSSTSTNTVQVHAYPQTGITLSAQTTIFSENFGTTSNSTTNIASTTQNAGWTNPVGTSSTKLTTTTSSASTGYSGASGGANVISVANQSGTPNATDNLLVSPSINTTGYGAITVMWAARGTSGYTFFPVVQYSTDGSSWNNLPFVDVSNTGTWELANGGTPIPLPASCNNITTLKLRWIVPFMSVNSNYRIDDVVVKGLPLSALTFCNDIASYSLAYSATAQSPDKYTITYDAAALTAGFTNITNHSFPVSSPITVPVPSGIGGGTYNATLTVTNTAEGCSADYPYMVKLNAVPAVPTITVSNETSGIASNDGIICNGASLTLNAPAGYSYAWSTNASSVTTQATGTLSPTINPTTYALTITDANNCVNTGSYSVTVNSNPSTPTISVTNENSGNTNNDGIICNGGTLKLNAPANFTYQWSANALSATTQATGILSPTVNPTTYSLTVTDVNNCSKSNNYAVTVNSNPATPTITVTNETSGIANNDGIVCAGGTLTLTSSVATTYKWSSNAADAATQAVNLSPATGSTVYSLTVSDANGCNNSNNYTVTVNGNASVQLGSSTALFTEGFNSGLPSGWSINTPSGASYAWTSTSSLASTGYTGASGGNNFIVAQSAAGANATTTSQLISAAYNITGYSNISVIWGARKTNSYPGSGSFYYSTNGTVWTQVPFLDVTGNSTWALVNGGVPISIPSLNGATSLYLRWDAQAVTDLSNYRMDDISIYGLANITACASDVSVNVHYASSANSTGYSLTSTLPNFIIQTGTLNSGSGNISVVIPASSSAGNYSFGLVLSNSSTSCSSTYTIPVTLTSPSAGTNGTTTGCGSVSLTATGAGAGGSYLWSGGSSTGTAANTFSSSNTYNVTVTTSQNCSASTSSAVTVNTVPSAGITGTTTGCGSVSLTATGAGVGGSYLWSGGSSIGTAANTFSSSNTYNVTVTTAQNCSASTSSAVTVNTIPSAGITGTTTDCGSVSLTATGAGAGGSYLWSGGSSTGTAANTFSSSNTYNVTVTTSQNCSASTSSAVTVNTIPLAGITGTTTGCGSVSLTATGAGAGGSYLWSGGSSAGTAANTFSSSNTYNVTVTTAQNCSASTSSAVTVNTIPSAGITGTTTGCGSVSLTATGAGAGGSYLWSGGSSTGTAANTFSSSNTYNVTVTTAQNCSASNSAAVTITSPPTWYKDADGDLYSDGTTLVQCAQPANYYAAASLTALTGDCNDGNASIHPGAAEICGNGIDEDCNGSDLVCSTVNTWLGNTTQWGLNTNWSNGVVPNSCAADVLIPSGLGNYPQMASAFSVGNITLQAGATISVGLSLTVCGNLTGSAGAPSQILGNGYLVFTGTNKTITGYTVFSNIDMQGTYTVGAAAGDKIEVTGILKKTSGNLTTANKLTLKSTASQTGLIQEAGGNLTGKITVERYIPGTAIGYRDLSAPVSSLVSDWAADFSVVGANNVNCWYAYSPYPTLQVYKESDNTATDNFFGGFFSFTGSSLSLTPMKGYAARLYSTPITVTTTGIPNNGPKSIAITKTVSTSPAADGWNLIGDPYPSPVSWNAIKALNAGKTDGSSYRFIATSEFGGNWATWNGVAGTNGATDEIASTQGFWVLANSNTTLNIDNSVRTTGVAPTFFKTRSMLPDEVRLELSNGILTDEIVSYTDANASFGYDVGYDAVKMAAGSAVYISFDMPDKEYAINVLDVVTDQTELPLLVSVSDSGNYTITATSLNLNGLTAYLKDALTNTLYDLSLTAPSFTFRGGQTYSGRFSIVFKTAVVSGINVNNEPAARIYSSGDKVFVERNSSNPATISIANVLGQQVTEIVSDKTKTEISLPGWELWYAFVKVTEGTKVSVAKVLISNK